MPETRTRTVTRRRDVDDVDATAREENAVPTNSKNDLPAGLAAGFAGVEAVSKMSKTDFNRLAISKEPQLIRVLEDEPFATFRQHWMAQGGGQPNRPYVCIGSGCPLCDLGNESKQVVCFNVLHLSEDAAPAVKIMQLTKKATINLQDAAKDKVTEDINLQRWLFAVSKSGTGFQTTTNFRPVKQRDIEDDWPEVLEQFELSNLDEIIADAMDNLNEISIIKVSTMQELKEAARFAVSED